jgi:hypothetical protein
MERRRHWTGYDVSGLSSDERDRLIVSLKRKGWSAARIAGRVGMSKGGVQFALERITDGRPGRDPRR